MRIATFNIRHGARDGLFARNRQLLQACQDLDADVLCLQEVDSHVIRSGFRDQARYIAVNLGMEYCFDSAQPKLVTGQQGNAILTRGSILEHRVIPLVRRSGDEQRIATLAQLAVYGQTLTLVNTHLQNPVSSADRQGTLDQLTEVIGEMDGQTGLSVLCGDLNLSRRYALGPIEQAGFDCGPEHFTIPSNQPVRQIDFVAVRGGEVLSVRVGIESVSDHLPLIADVA
ncbi:MAG: endonuclease/exonuclease/phosphatase family protein [Acidimicrobiia bacterium]|jgi:endonuclease/exonuclease/phosphatase family metal-dependent hydrolase|nr:endonuclease/exonuclease/phosphatase family protein [Acidimicrobiia bacterium]MBP8179968.1 endonuclease/exonuclease/phosphatase family protein [Acidimicrobiia bacterium]